MPAHLGDLVYNGVDDVHARQLNARAVLVRDREAHLRGTFTAGEVRARQLPRDFPELLQARVAHGLHWQQPDAHPAWHPRC